MASPEPGKIWKYFALLRMAPSRDGENASRQGSADRLTAALKSLFQGKRFAVLRLELEGL